MESDGSMGEEGRDVAVGEIQEIPSTDNIERPVDAYWMSVTAQRLQFTDRFHHQPYSSNAANRAHAAVETELKAIDRSAVVVRRRLNAFCLMARLAPETLAHIFLVLADVQPHFYPDPADFPNLHCHVKDHDETSPLEPRLGWIGVTHVCHHWREVALAYPHLWSNVTFSLGPEWAQELLCRSKQVPILIDYWDPGQDSGELLCKIVRDNIHRTHTIHLLSSISSEEANEDDRSSFSLPAPLPHTFRIYYKPEVWHDWQPSLLARGVPSLVELDLHGVDIVPWKLSIVHNLTRLSIVRDPETWEDNSPQLPGLGEVLDVLRQMHNLEVLEIQGPLPTSRSNKVIPFDVQQLVYMPQLVKLALGGPISELAVFLSLLHLGPVTKVKLEGVVDTNHPVETAILAFTILKVHLTSLADIHDMHVTSKDTRHGLFIDEVATWKEDRSLVKDGPDIVVSLCISLRHMTWYQNIDIAHCIFSLGSVRRLSLSIDRKFTPLSAERWHTIFLQSYHAMHVDVNGASASSLLDALVKGNVSIPQPHANTPVPDGAPHLPPPLDPIVILFPDLETMVLRCVAWNFPSGVNLCKREYTKDHQWSNLRKLVEMRAKGPHPLKTVLLD